MGAKQSKQKKNESAQPPPYRNEEPLKIWQEKRQQYPEIKASDVPGWKWTNVQCQVWLTVAIMEYCGRSEKVAEKKAREFLRGGFATMLYAASYRVWESYLGKEDAPAIFSYLTMHKATVVPSGVYLTTYDIPTKKGYYE